MFGNLQCVVMMMMMMMMLVVVVVVVAVLVVVVVVKISREVCCSHVVFACLEPPRFDQLPASTVNHSTTPLFTTLNINYLLSSLGAVSQAMSPLFTVPSASET